MVAFILLSPPDKKTIPGTSLGTLPIKHSKVLSAVLFIFNFSSLLFPGTIIFGFSKIPFKSTFFFFKETKS